MKITLLNSGLILVVLGIIFTSVPIITVIVVSVGFMMACAGIITEIKTDTNRT